MNLTEKAAYLKGLADGLKLDTESDTGKLLSAVIDVIQTMAEDVADLYDNADAVSDELDMIEDDLDEIKEFLSDDEDDEDYELYDNEDEDGMTEDDEYVYEVTCPTCSKPIEVDEQTMASGKIECPYCGEKLELEADDE